MEKREIIRRSSELQSRDDLLKLINDIVKDEVNDDHAFSFSEQQLAYYCNPNNIRGRYRHFSIPKKSGGVRRIAAPSKGLGHILYYVNILLKTIYKPSEYAMGFTEGRSIVDNASRHIGQNYVFNTDLANFFPSIQQARVWKRLQLAPFNFNTNVANTLAGLCCIREKLEDGTFVFVLPQGAPTSPLITNAICDTLDHRLSGLARRFCLHYSRYADDITFSSMHNVYQQEGAFRKELKRIIEGQNFRINESKTRLQKKGQRQEVTGLTVGTRINVSKKYVSEIRTILHIWEKYGYNDAYKSFYPRYKVNKGHVKKGEPMLENVLYGKLLYLKMVKGEKDPVYSALQSRYDRLTSPINAETSSSLDYLRSFTISEFEEIVGTSIQYCLSKDNNLYGKAKLNEKEIIISITAAAKTELVKNKMVTDEALVKSVKPVKYCIPSNSKPGLYVVLTARNGKIPFWMMTYYDPTVSDLDQSIVPASELIAIWAKDGIDTAIKTYEEGIQVESKQHKDKKKKNSKKKGNNFNLDVLGIDSNELDSIISEIPDIIDNNLIIDEGTIVDL